MQTQPYVDVTYILLTIDETHTPLAKKSIEKLLLALYECWNPTKTKQTKLSVGWVKHEKT